MASVTYDHVVKRYTADITVVKVEPRIAVQPGGKIRLGLDSRGTHMFDAETELALL